jgi:hypothetical protein
VSVEAPDDVLSTSQRARASAGLLCGPGTRGATRLRQICALRPRRGHHHRVVRGFGFIAYDAAIGQEIAHWNLGAHKDAVRRTEALVLCPDRWLEHFEELSIKQEVRPLILKENAIKLLGLNDSST